jgi:hypothetical protein
MFEKKIFSVEIRIIFGEWGFLGGKKFFDYIM